jgi:hypothetical protein
MEMSIPRLRGTTPQLRSTEPYIAANAQKHIRKALIDRSPVLLKILRDTPQDDMTLSLISEYIIESGDVELFQQMVLRNKKMICFFKFHVKFLSIYFSCVMERPAEEIISAFRSILELRDEKVTTQLYAAITRLVAKDLDLVCHILRQIPHQEQCARAIIEALGEFTTLTHSWLSYARRFGILESTCIGPRQFRKIRPLPIGGTKM